MNRWLAGLAASVLAGAAVPSAQAPGTRPDLEYLLKHDCGSCHGMRLAGGLGPPLTADALGGYPVEFVADVILHGRGGTAMPPFRALLDPGEARWLAEYLLRGEKP